MLPLVIMGAYLIFNGAWEDFISYTILAIPTFDNKIPYWELLESDQIVVRILVVLVPIVLLILAVLAIYDRLNKKKQTSKEVVTLLAYAISMIIVVYPISDNIHFWIASIITLLGMIYLVYKIAYLIYQKIQWTAKKRCYKSISMLLYVGIGMILFLAMFQNIRHYCQNPNLNLTINHYANIQIPEYLKSRIQEIDNYILQEEEKGNNINILDAEAAVHHIPINQYEKDYDLFLKGNLGKKDQEGQIEKIKTRKKKEFYLIRSQEMSQNWQTPMKVINYIRENLQKIGEVNMFEIYQ